MYCEIVVYHRKQIDGPELAKLLSARTSGPTLTVADAYKLSSVYRGRDPYGSLSAYRANQHCFAILQMTNHNQPARPFEACPVLSVASKYKLK